MKNFAVGLLVLGSCYTLVTLCIVGINAIVALPANAGAHIPEDAFRAFLLVGCGYGCMAIGKMWRGV